ncbi:Peptide chain release factor [Pseudomonas chlororaphis subsp. piscium]|uniref:peptide chain release factor H n=1 Tax=Pseudomonas chlororaphis TaxID=587753 RepID=UPI0006A6222E|nr:peptide chain release factor H [Pseudomonas chlororaphis]AZC32384.1 Peptide chain release factor [Pseudomonas chlororaphis subsp. piscium]WDG90102.1 peptide chain release factor H [Pseudomonas chlororaphis]SDS65825.1 peptide chain release factor [Pseudomonas chlororaphis]
MILLQLSSAQGPAECELAVAKALQRLDAEAEAEQVRTSIVESEPGASQGTYKSVLIGLGGDQAASVARRWSGTLLWVCKSPYRPGHKRKNWFFAGQVFTAPEQHQESQIRFETMRASGPGGQHVNKTDSAVRATHLATGISVKVQSERSQHDNRRMAILLINQRIAAIEQTAQMDMRLQRRDFHHGVERGNPQRSFTGVGFIPRN